ncbi:MAG: hypothetical protein Q7V88_11300 [Actinomycetota bacterium]|nr:hypothetical protein [Actinomycetota bacterium]
MDRSEIDELKADLQRMQSRIDELETHGEQPVNRRNMLRGLGAAAVGAAAGGLAFAHPAAATDGGNIIIGNATQTSTSPTALVPTTGWGSSPLTGAFTVTNDASFTSVNAALSCITAYADSNQDSGHTIGLFGASKAGIGAKLDGPVPLKLTDNTNSGAPTQTSGTNGQFKVDDGDLWYCADDNSATKRWRKLSGPGVAGSYHALTPGRVYDSRPAAAGAGPLAAGNNRTISVANSINSAGGTVTTNFVPAFAAAVVANVTVVNTVNGGNIAVNPGGNLSTATSTVNWNTSGAVLANGITLTLNASRQLTVVCSGSGSTNFIVDVFGYYL